MRLSDIKGERTLDVIAEIIDPVANIAMDPEAAEFFAKKKRPEGVGVKEYVLGRVRKSVPALLKNHKRDLLTILAVIQGVSVEEYSEDLGLLKLTNDILDLVNDSTFVALFISAQSVTTSGSAQENTEAPAQ